MRFFRERGVLPRAGGRLDQHPKFLEGIELVEQEIEQAIKSNEAREAARKKLRQELRA